MRQVCEVAGAGLAFLAFQFFLSDLFPTSAGGEFHYNWQRGATAIAIVIGGMLLGRFIGNAIGRPGRDG